MIKIALFTYSTKLRGGVIHTIELAEALQAAGHHVCIYALDTERFSSEVNGREAELKQQLGINGNPVYLTIGGIEPRKNSLKLLQAFIKVLKTHPQAQLIITGGETLFYYEPYAFNSSISLDNINLKSESL